jgi:hypothetical protein
MDQLVGLANNTKWSELQTIMSGFGTRAPYWRSKSTNGFVYPSSGWDGDWICHFRLGRYRLIEWCEMTPRATTDSLPFDQLIDVCRKIGFEFEIAENVIRIVGYRRL